MISDGKVLADQRSNSSLYTKVSQDDEPNQEHDLEMSTITTTYSFTSIRCIGFLLYCILSLLAVCLFYVLRTFHDEEIVLAKLDGLLYNPGNDQSGLGMDADMWNDEERLTELLINLEANYGGFHAGVNCSHLDIFIGKGYDGQGCTGGDRMKEGDANHGYAPTYAKILKHLGPNAESIAEVGILEGTGLAMWSHIWPLAKVHGFDLSLENTKNSTRYLTSKGGFASRNVYLHEMDQFHPGSIPKDASSSYDLVIDDGLHNDESAILTFNAFEKLIRPGGVYVAEDFKAEGLRAVIQNNSDFFDVDFVELRYGFLVVAWKKR